MSKWVSVSHPSELELYKIYVMVYSHKFPYALPNWKVGEEKFIKVTHGNNIGLLIKYNSFRFERTLTSELCDGIFVRDLTKKEGIKVYHSITVCEEEFEYDFNYKDTLKQLKIIGDFPKYHFE